PVESTGIKLRDLSIRVSSHSRRGTSWERAGERGIQIKDGPPLPDPLLPLWGGEGEFLATSPVLFLNSMAVHPGSRAGRRFPASVRWATGRGGGLRRLTPPAAPGWPCSHGVSPGCSSS